MMTSLAHFLFTHTRNPQPDGRALYAYKASADAYRYLLDDVRKGLDNRRFDGEFPAKFCIYAAETFRREHAGGPWKWETIFQPLGREVPAHAPIHSWVQIGLARWRRPLLVAPAGHTLFLVTLACEGGLPMRLLAQEEAHLTRYLRAVLERYEQGGNGGEQTAEKIARAQVQRLPPSLRQEPVLHLTGELIAAVCVLRPPVAGAADPIAALDQTTPHWRRELPLRLDDEVAERLLRGMLTLKLPKSPRWCGELGRSGADWQVRRRLDLPEIATVEQLQAWTGIEPQGPRLRLLIDTERGMEPIAWLTRIDGCGTEARYRREWLRPGGLVRVGAAVLSPQRIVLTDAEHEAELRTVYADPWGPLPWLFIEHGSAGHWQWLTEGAGQTRAERAIVVATPGMLPDAGDCAPQGRIADLDRLVFEITGAVQFQGADGECCRIVCGAESDSSASFELRGAKLPLSGRSRPVYRGLPTFALVDDASGGWSEAGGTLQWRPIGDQGPWRSRAAGGSGLLWVRLLDEQGQERCRRQAEVVPCGLAIHTKIGAGNAPGVVRLTQLGGTRVRADIEANPSRTSLTLDANGVDIVCPVLPAVAPEPLAIELSWPDTTPLRLAIPYPQRGAYFDLEGRALGDDAGVPLDRVGGLRLVVQDPAGGTGYWLRIELLADGAFPVLQDRLPALEQGRLDYSLYRWQDRIASLLASGGDLEDEVRLSVETRGGQRLARLRVSRFDAIIEPDREAGLARLPEDTRSRLGSDWQQRVRLAMFPLWQPDAEHLPLQPSEVDEGVWTVPSDLDPGPWWIVGHDGDWARFRPLLWVAADEARSEPTSVSPLADAIREPHPLRREQAIGEILAALGASADHPDWPLLMRFIELSQAFPPTSLDVLCALSAQPQTLAQALLRADEPLFEALWSLSARMPFLWMLLPVSAWRDAAVQYFGSLRQSLSGIESAEDLVLKLFQAFRERVVDRRPYWRPLCDWLQEQVFPDQPVPANSELGLARVRAVLLEQSVDQEERDLMGRHDANARWPTGDAVGGLMAGIGGWMQQYRYQHLAGFYRPVRQAPFVAAYIAVHGIEPQPRLTYELRLLRAFDRDWFDRVHAIAFTIELAQSAPAAIQPET